MRVSPSACTVLLYIVLYRVALHDLKSTTRSTDPPASVGRGRVLAPSSRRDNEQGTHGRPLKGRRRGQREETEC